MTPFFVQAGCWFAAALVKYLVYLYYCLVL